MANADDNKLHVSDLTNTSRNKRQASILLNEVARNQSEIAARKCAQSAEVMKECKATFEKARKLRDRRAG